MATPLTGSLATRRLGTRSGDLRRMARQADNPRLRASLEAQAAEEKAAERDANSPEARYAARIQGGLLESRRRAMGVQGAGGVQGASGVQGADDGLSPAESRQKFYADQRASRMAFYGRQAAGTPLTPASYGPQTLASRAPSVGASIPGIGQAVDLAGTDEYRQGRIDGRPASEVLRPTASDEERMSIIGRMREGSRAGSATRQDVLDQINRERMAEGKPAVEISGRELADMDRAEAGSMRPSAAGAEPRASVTPAYDSLLARRYTQGPPASAAMDVTKSVTPAAPVPPSTAPAAAAPALAARRPAPSTPTARFVGNEPAAPAKSISQLDAESKARHERYLKTFGRETPETFRGTAVGSLLERLSKPLL